MLLLCSLFSPLLSMAQGETLCWQIVGVGVGCERKSAKRSADVHIDPCYLPKTSGSGFFLNGEDFDAVPRHFAVRAPKDLIGKWFASPAEYRASRAGTALLALTQKPRAGRSVTPQVIYERAAAAVSRFEMPDYSDLDPIAVLKTFEQVFDCGKTFAKPRLPPGGEATSTMGWGANEEWLGWFRGRVAQLSRGRVRVRRIDCKKGENGSTCGGHGRPCGAEELVAVGPNGRKVRFDLGHWNTYALRLVDQGECALTEYWRE